MAPLVAFLRARLPTAGPPAHGLTPGRIGRAEAFGGVKPTFNPLTVDEAALLMQGLYEVDKYQFEEAKRMRLAGHRSTLPVPGELSAGLHQGRIRYIRQDSDERWRTVRDIVAMGGGDCEDLAAAVAAELTVSGTPARPVIYRVRPGLSHAVVQLADGRLIDPSRTGGMGRE